MRKAADKQKSVALRKVLLNVRLKLIKNICCNILDIDGRINLMDRIALNVRRIVGNCRLAHQRKLNGLPVFRILADLRILRDLVLTALPQPVQIVSVVDHLDIGIV